MKTPEFQREHDAMRAGPPCFWGIPDEVAGAKIHSRIGAVIGTWSNNKPLLLLGPTGSGKSLGAAMIIRRLVRMQPIDRTNDGFPIYRKPAIFWANAVHLAHADKRHKLGEGAPDAVKSAIDADICVLDDILWGSRDEALLEVVSGRYNAGVPTIATAGSSFADVMARLGEAVLRRLLECRGESGTIVDLFAAKAA